MSERSNFHLAELDDQRCSLCQHSAIDSDESTYCMLGLADGAAATDGQRVNQNFVCDSFAAK